MNISENLQRIQGAKADIKNALNTKQNAGITDQKLDSYSNFVKTPSIQKTTNVVSNEIMYNYMSSISSSSITWTSGNAEDVFQSTSADVLTIKSSSSSSRVTGYLFFNLPKRYFIHEILYSSTTYSGTWYLPYYIKLECYDYRNETWDIITTLDPNGQGFSFKQSTQYSYFSGFQETSIFDSKYSPSLTDMYTNSNELRYYRLSLKGSTYNSSLGGHIISLRRILLRGFDIVGLTNTTLSWN